jgi:hypothetical protein
MKGQNQHARILCERQAADYLGAVTIRTLQDWRMRRVGPPYVKLGRRIGYRLDDLDEFVSASRVIPKPAGRVIARANGGGDRGAGSQ